ncbi:MAG: hypothetical protein QOJ43_2015 [Gaiellaceae bacterium]|nr:hypothetical protein [Gaiellaceae bacterium]
MGRRAAVTMFGALRSDPRLVLAGAAGDPLASAGAIVSTAALGAGVCSRGVGVDAICATVSWTPRAVVAELVPAAGSAGALRAGVLTAGAFTAGTAGVWTGGTAGALTETGGAGVAGGRGVGGSCGGCGVWVTGGAGVLGGGVLGGCGTGAATGGAATGGAATGGAAGGAGTSPSAAAGEAQARAAHVSADPTPRRTRHFRGMQSAAELIAIWSLVRIVTG